MKCALDCDPGHDDLVMIMLAVYSPELDVQYISTTHGNQTVSKTYQNARRTLTLINRADRIPVYRGYAQPLLRASVACPEIHGESGLGGVDWSSVDAAMPPNPALARLGYSSESELRPTDFFAHLHALITASESYFDVIATGPQTNIAQYLLAYPADGARLRVRAMAGNFLVVGNISPFAEFNVLVDPEAVRHVIACAADYIFAAPLDITHTVLVDATVLARVRAATAASPRFAEMIVSLLLFFQDTYRDVFGFASPPLHDPVAAFHAIAPDAFSAVRCRVDIECAGEFTAGACCTDLVMRRKGEAARGENATVCLALREGGLERFWAAMTGAWARIAEEIG